MIRYTQYKVLFLLAGLVYIASLFVTLFENDSAQFAVMAMRMVQEQDFLNLFKGPEEYLDKPHLHYWLAAASYLIFGIHDWAYRIPALLATALGAYSCFGLAKVFYDRETGRLAALIFLTSQTIVLAGIDVRTDAVLTGLAAFSLWQLATYLQGRSAVAALLGAVGAGLAFATKGQIALVVIGIPLLCQMAYMRTWKVLLSWKVLLAILVFLLTISPILYAYYYQFDLHPEKVIRGRQNRSGVLFILWEQSFERLSGEGVGKNSSDYLFFFHTFLWVFLPWTIVGLVAWWGRLKAFFRRKPGASPPVEVLTVGGVSLIFLIISFAQFKLPHYLNITIPLFAVLASSYLHEIYRKGNRTAGKWIRAFQYGILGLVLLLSYLLVTLVFPLSPWYGTAFLYALLLGCFILILWRRDYYSGIALSAVMASLLLNSVLNLHFYPRLLTYQAGSSMAAIVAREGIPPDKIHKISERHTWALDFYNREPVKITPPGRLGRMNDIWVYVTDSEKEKLASKGMVWDKEYSVDDFRITRLQFRFLNPETRAEVVKEMHLIHLP